MTGAELLVARSLTKSYGPLLVLKGVDFTVRRGEVVCLLGENGAGKSTLSKIIAGIERSDGGRIEIDGTEVQFKTPGAAQDAGIRVVPQELTLVPELSVAENIHLGALPRRRNGTVDWATARRTAADRLAGLAMDHIDVTTPVDELRVVDKAFVQIARALTPGARILIADEPTAPMSGGESERLIKVLEAIKNSGVGVVFISHRLDEVLRLGDTVAVLRDGVCVLDENVADLTRSRMVEAMTGRRVDESATEAAAPIDHAHPVLEIESLASGAATDVSLTVSSGEIVGLYGNTGSGREDVGPAAFGARRLRDGTVRIDGRDVRLTNPRAAIRNGIAYVPAERRSQALSLEMSIRENLTMAHLRTLFVRNGFIEAGRERSAATEWIARMAMKAGGSEVPVGTLSGGTQQKVVLARWLLVTPKVLVLDDPTRGVDISSKHEIYEILRNTAAQGSGVLVISSDAEELENVCDRVAVLRDGRVVEMLSSPTQNQILAAAQV